MKTRRIRRRSRGFTLMEVLLVLAILVILSGLATVAIIQTQKAAYRKTAKLQIDSYVQACTTYQLELGTLPETLVDLRVRPANIPAGKEWHTFLDKDVQTDPWGREYIYEVQESEDGEQVVRISSAGPNGSPGDADDISNI